MVAHNRFKYISHKKIKQLIKLITFDDVFLKLYFLKLSLCEPKTVGFF